MARKATKQSLHDDDIVSDSVCYWRMSQPQVEHPSSFSLKNNDNDASSDAESCSSSSSSSTADEDYEVLMPGDAKTRRILQKSEYYNTFMPSSDPMSESVLSFCSCFPIRMGPILVSSLIRRITDVKFNWQTKTLQSFLELSCWLSVTYAAYAMYHDVMWALEVGLLCGALISVCDEIVLQFAQGLARVIRNQHGGSELLQRFGFDVPKNGKAPTNGHEVELIKTVVFGYVGVIALRAAWLYYHDVKHFALLTIAVCVAVVVTGELFCLWLPTRRIGLTLQSRWTGGLSNWREHPVRSCVELTCWGLSTLVFYHAEYDFWASLQLGTSVAILLCLCSGLEELPGVDDTMEKVPNGGVWFWQASADERQGEGEVWLKVAGMMVKVLEVGEGFGKFMNKRAMDIMEGFNE